MNKREKFKENATFKRLYQPELSFYSVSDFALKGKWNELAFKKNRPIFLEVGCGKGTYTLGLSARFADRNFIGMDIKGSRIWHGAKKVETGDISNALFLRTRVEFSNLCFAENEISGLWITFPDPHFRRSEFKKRLVSPFFLSIYSKFLSDDGEINLKTDNDEFFEYALRVIEKNDLLCVAKSFDVHSDSSLDGTEIKDLKTDYELKFLDEGKKIKFVRFSLQGKKVFSE